MYREVKELKRLARINLQGNYMELIRAFVFCDIIVSLVELPFLFMKNDVALSTSNLIYYAAMILIEIASVVLTAGQFRLHLDMARTGKVHPAELFVPLKYHSNRFIFTQLILFGISALCMIPMGGAIAIVVFVEDISLYIVALLLALLSCGLMVYITLTFDLVYFVMNDHEELSMVDALKYAKNMITTHRKRYLYMQLSFLGMMLLVLLSMGIAQFWVHPYMLQTITLFYLDVKGELDEVLENRQKESSPEPTTVDMYA